MALEDYGTSIVRTVVPWIVGNIVTLAAMWGFDVDPGALVPVVTVAVGAAYYALVRKIEQDKPEIGKLLGKAIAPAYDKGDN